MMDLVIDNLEKGLPTAIAEVEAIKEADTEMMTKDIKGLPIQTSTEYVAERPTREERR